MGPHERGRFAPEAWGHLLSLNGSGAINGLELEHIIERALMQFEGRIALDDCVGSRPGRSWRAGTRWLLSGSCMRREAPCTKPRTWF